ncbi:meiosis-specific coiled-coil domain-containing protein MEIOC-like [Leptidea sinapis]|uniref:meiosis-specific coiled-coil domain-containing protein MEIOC-like n=1 Tax=Leptidea sinapis TaxID=189913 RepID=UPI002125BC16|nr:meiosis-specific coiled-coil domain-containing protein MEIOC-like [Leptidea sinapis]
MAFSDLCHISNAFKTVENETDQSDRIMEENSMVRDLITKILDEPGPTEGNCSLQTSEKAMSDLQNSINNYPNVDTGSSFVFPPTYNTYPNNLYNLNQNEQNNFSFMQNGFNPNAFVNYQDNDVNTLVGIEPVTDETVTPEQLNLLRLAAQEIGGAQFAIPNKYDEKYYNFFEPSQRNSLPETNMFPQNFNRPNSMNLDMNYNANYDFNNTQRYPNKFENGFVKENETTLLSYLNNLNLSNDRRDESLIQNNDFKMPLDMNSHYQNDEFKFQEKQFYNRNFQQPNNFHGDINFFIHDVMPQMPDRNNMGQNFDYPNQSVPQNSVNFKPNGYNHPNEFMQRRDMTPILSREGFQNGSDQRPNYDNTMNRDGQQALLRQQEIAKQMNLLMRTRPPPNPLNIDVSFMHENTPYLGLGAMIRRSPSVPTPVLPSPLVDSPVLAPFYTMRGLRNSITSSSILHARLDACYEQWKQLERERKRTEARLALAYPGRAVSSSNSIPVPRLPPCPTRVDRLTVDMLREHTKVLTLMGKMETLRASVCVAQNKRPNKPDDGKITVLKRHVEDKGLDPATFDPTSWKEDIKHLSEIAPHTEIEGAMLAWRNAVASVQAARRRELTPAQHRYPHTDPILQLADAVKQLCVCARRARAAMWCDLTLTVALAPHNHTAPGESPQNSGQQTPRHHHEPPVNGNKPDAKDEKLNETKPEEKMNKQTDKDKNRRAHNYRHKNNTHNRNDLYKNRFVRHPYYIATGSIH